MMYLALPKSRFLWSWKSQVLHKIFKITQREILSYLLSAETKLAIITMYCRRKSEKVTSDVTDLIDTKNGPIKFSTLRDSTSRPPSFNHSPLERQRSFSNPSFMDHDIDILAQNLEQEPQQDTEQLQKEN